MIVIIRTFVMIKLIIIKILIILVLYINKTYISNNTKRLALLTSVYNACKHMVLRIWLITNFQ